MWATGHIKRLQEGETVSFRPWGNSMSPKIKSGQLVIVAPVEGNLEVGDIVLCQVGGHQYLHLVKAIKGDRYQIGNNKGRINGWIGKTQIFGRLVSK